MSPRYFNLGVTTLKEAEEIALKFTRSLQMGRNPLDDIDRQSKKSTQASKQSTPFITVLNEYDEFRKKNDPNLADDAPKNRSKDAYLRNKNRVYKLVKKSKTADLRIDRIDSEVLYKILSPIPSVQTLAKARASLGKVLDWAKRMKYTARNEIADAVKNVRLDKKATLKKISHFPSLSWEELPMFYEELSKVQVSMSSLAVKFSVLTVMRNLAVRTLKYGDIKVTKEASKRYKVAMLKPENNKLKDENARRDIVLSKTALTVIDEASKLFEKMSKSH